MPVEAQPPTYQTCAVVGGAQLAGGSLVDLGKAQFSFKPANCSYSSEPSKPAPHWAPHNGHCMAHAIAAGELIQATYGAHTELLWSAGH